MGSVVAACGLSCPAAYGILVPQPGIEPASSALEGRFLTTGPPENLRPQGIFIGVRSPGGPDLSTKTQLYPTAYKLQCWKPQAKQPVRQGHNPTYKKKKGKKKQDGKKNMSQMKEQGKNLQDQINEEEIGNLPERQFRVMIVKMIQNLGNRTD